MGLTSRLNAASTSSRLKATPFLRAAHRLDRPVSGVLLMAKTKTALTTLMEQFEQRLVEKVYVALVEKRPPEEAGTLSHFLKKDAEGKKALVSSKSTKDAWPVTLHYKILELRGNGALLELRPEGGRYHQIRAQLAQAGWPIAGDVLYGGKAWQPDCIKLHARDLRFLHPKTGLFVELQAPMPTDW